MSDDIWKRAEIQSPCVKICVIHPQEKLCTGCLRSLDEIGNWSRMSAQERAVIMDQLPSRKSRLTKRRGGRSARLKSPNA